jgi:hypothetical protein
MICGHCKFKTYNREICEWCYQNPMEPKEAKTKEQEDAIEDQVDDEREKQKGA